MKKIISLILFAVLFVSMLTPLASNAKFTDVYSGRCYTYPVDFVTRRGYMTGTGDSVFSPHKSLTRAELAVILNALDNHPTYEGDDPDMDFEPPFSDIERAKWYTDAVIWAHDCGFFAGYPDGAFGVDIPVTRAQFVTVMRAFADFKGYETAGTASLEKFADCSAVGKWAVTAFGWAYETGVIAGSSHYGKLYLNPNMQITRAEAAIMITAFCFNIVEKEQKALLNGKYVLDGGGGSGGSDSEAVMQEIYDLADKEHPDFLYIGFAVSDPSGDVSWAKNYFGEGFGCNVDYLSEEDIKDPAVARAKVENADIVYVGGGDTRRLVSILKQSGVDTMLRTAAKRGCVMAGSSAGAICFCESGESSVLGGFMRVDGIGCLNLLYCPHSLTDNGRFDKIPAEVESTPYMKCAAIDGAALEIANGKYRVIITAKHGYQADLCSWENGEFKTVEISTEWRDVSELGVKK